MYTFFVEQNFWLAMAFRVGREPFSRPCECDRNCCEVDCTYCNYAT